MTIKAAHLQTGSDEKGKELKQKYLPWGFVKRNRSQRGGVEDR